MKKLFRVSLSYCDIVFSDRYFETYEQAESFGHKFLDDQLKTDPLYFDLYEVVIVECEGVVL